MSDPVTFSASPQDTLGLAISGALVGQASDQAVLNLMAACRIAQAAGIVDGCAQFAAVLLAECSRRGLDAAGAEASARSTLLAIDLAVVLAAKAGLLAAE